MWQSQVTVEQEKLNKYQGLKEELEKMGSEDNCGPSGDRSPQGFNPQTGRVATADLSWWVLTDNTA